jgi:RimJ/RimL family protein N-acetyltransferase
MQTARDRDERWRMCRRSERPGGDELKTVDRIHTAMVTSFGEQEYSLLLWDGTYVPARRIRPGDAGALQRFHSRLSEQSIYRRFFGMVPELSDDRALYFTHFEQVSRIALVALDPQHTYEIIAVVRLDALPDMRSAEYAAIVEDRWQGRGVGYCLTQRLFEIAGDRGLRKIVAFVLSGNDRMVTLLRDIGLPSRTRCEAGLTRIELDLPPQPDSIAAPYLNGAPLASQ